jgi:hypothetical protein
MIDFTLPEDLATLRDGVRRFAREDLMRRN